LPEQKVDKSFCLPPAYAGKFFELLG